MSQIENKDTQALDINRLQIRIKHLENELNITKEEHNDAIQNYYELYSTLEDKVKERTHELKNAMQKIHKYNTILESLLEERTRELIKTERHAAFSLLSQGIVHNLKNPLTIIHGSAQILRYVRPDLENEQLSERISTYLDSVKTQVDRIDNGVERMLAMINSLMTKSRSDKSENIERTDINTILHREIEFLEADQFFKHKVKKNIHLYERPLLADVVPGEISQIFQNLIRNALDAMYDMENPELIISSGKDHENVWFYISDNGPGIAEENQKKIFDPFFTTKPKAGEAADGKPTGTGLGLHMCMQMAQSYKGTITVQSKPGVGTVIKVILPSANKIKSNERKPEEVHEVA